MAKAAHAIPATTIFLGAAPTTPPAQALTSTLTVSPVSAILDIPTSQEPALTGAGKTRYLLKLGANAQTGTIISQETAQRALKIRFLTECLVSAQTDYT